MGVYGRRAERQRRSPEFREEGAPPLTVCPFPASGRPIRTQLGALNSPVSGPLLLQPCTRASCGRTGDSRPMHRNSIRWSMAGAGSRPTRWNHASEEVEQRPS